MDIWIFQYGLGKQGSPGFVLHPATVQRHVKRRAGPLRFLLGLTLLNCTGVVFNPGVKPARSQGLQMEPGKLAFQERPVPYGVEKATSTSIGASPDTQGDQTYIGADDLLDITVFEAPEMNRTLRVSANGEISLQLLGAVKAAGLTPRELELVLQELLRRSYMKDPHVGVFIQELQSHPVSVVGAVKMPGVFQIRGSKTVLELLSMAEGLTDDAGDTVTIMRGAEHIKSAGGEGLEPFKSGTAGGSAPPQSGNGEIVEINLKGLLESDNPALNAAVYPGDIVKVSRAGIVYVVGGVVKPGGFVLKNNENISVLQALALAEGLTRTSAKSQARIIRTDQETKKRSEIPVNLGKILASKAPDPVLQARDIVYIPDSTAKGAFYRGAEAALSTATGVAIYRW